MARQFASDRRRRRSTFEQEGAEMAVAVQMDFDGATLDQYDEVIEKMGLTPKGPAPAGAISHFATMTDSGLRVVDVWETREQFEKFAQEQIGPFSAEAGFSGPPRMQFFEVHNYLTPGS
jgi:hypothetical protein